MDTNTIVSPAALWKDFDPAVPDLEITVVKTECTESLTVKSFYFTGLLSTDGKVRVYAKTFYRSRILETYGGRMPVVLLAADMYSKPCADTVEYLLDAGYAVMCFDLRGDSRNARYTLYPESLCRGRFDAAKDTLYLVDDNPKDTAWFIWTALARRAISVLIELKEFDSSRIGVVGIREGGTIAFALASAEERINCVCVFGCSGWVGYGSLYGAKREGDDGMFDEKHSRFLYSLSVESYAQLVKKPMFMHLDTNDDSINFDRAFDTQARLPQTLKSCLSVSLNTENRVCYTQCANLKLWLDYNIINVGYFPSTPVIDSYVSEGRLYAKLTAFDAGELANVRIRCAYGETDGAVRNWHTAKSDELKEGEYIASLDWMEPDKHVFCFGVVDYKNGASVSSRLIARKPVELGLKTTQLASSRLIYDSASGTDSFFSVGGAGFFNKRAELGIEDGPIGIKGVTTYLGDLATLKLFDPRYYGYENDLLHVNFYCADDADYCVDLQVFTLGRWGKTYSAPLGVVGSGAWQKKDFATADFKSHDGIVLSGWEDVALLRFRKTDPLNASKLLISSLLWA